MALLRAAELYRAHEGGRALHDGHTFGTQLLRNGVDIVVVADLMGHATLDTTRSYTRSSEADRARAIDQALIADE